MESTKGKKQGEAGCPSNNPGDAWESKTMAAGATPLGQQVPGSKTSTNSDIMALLILSIINILCQHNPLYFSKHIHLHNLT